MSRLRFSDMLKMQKTGKFLSPLSNSYLHYLFWLQNKKKQQQKKTYQVIAVKWVS